MNPSSQERCAPQDAVLLRELHHRLDAGVASAIHLVWAAAVRVEGAEAKAALSEVVDLLQGYAEISRLLERPAGQRLVHTASYIRKLGCAMRRSLLDRMRIELIFATQSIPLQQERCWNLGLIVHALVSHAARHALFDTRAGQIKIKLGRVGAILNCVVTDNGTRAARGTSDTEFRIGRELARALGGRIEEGSSENFTSVVLAFPLTEREREASGALALRQTKMARRETRFALPEAAAPGCTPKWELEHAPSAEPGCSRTGLAGGKASWPRNGDGGRELSSNSAVAP